MSKQDTAATLANILELGEKLITYEVAQKQADEARAMLDKEETHGQAWDMFVQALTESFPAELGVGISYERHRAVRRNSMGDVFFAPAVISIAQCVPILAYMGDKGIRYRVRAPWLEWDGEVTQSWYLRLANRSDDAHEKEYEYGDGATGWTSNPFIAVKMAHDADRLIPGLQVECSRRIRDNERPPRETEAMLNLRLADRAAPYNLDKALALAVLAIAHKMIDDN